MIVQKVLIEKQTVQTQIKLILMSSLIWVYIVFSGSFVPVMKGDIANRKTNEDPNHGRLQV